MKAATKGAIKISFIVLSVAVSIIFLAIFLIPVLAPDIVQEKKYIGSDNIEHGTKNETLGDFTVKFTHVESGISQQVFDISVQNLLNTNANANITSILEPLISGSIGGDVQLFEWKNISYTVPSYESILINETRWNETYSNETGELISNVSYEYSYFMQIQNGTDTLYKLDWKPSKQYLFNSNDKVETNYGVVNIDKFGSKQKDDTVNGTKLFRVVIPTKLVQTVDGWGSSGLFMIKVNGNTYYDTTNSSWWNSTWSYKKQINITAASTLPAGYTVNLTWDMTQANILNTGNDTRVVIDDGTNTLEIDRNITNNGTANSILEFKINSLITGGTENLTYYVYYGNTLAGNPPNNRTNVYYYFTGFEEYANSTQPAGWVKSDGNLYTTNELNSNPALFWSTGTTQPMSALYLGRNLTTKNYSISLNMYFKTNPTGHAGIAYKANTTQTNLEYYTQTDGDDFYHYSFVGGVQNQENIINSLKRNTGIWNTWQVDVYNESKTISGYFNGTLLSVYNGVGNLNGDRAYGLSGGYRVSPMYVDNLLVRLLVPSNPTITIGAEETSSNPPKWSNNQSSIGSLNQISLFNTTWTDDNDNNGYNFSFFELGFPNGTSNNYTAIRFPNNISHYNLTIPVAGTYNWTMYANDSSNDWNKTNSILIIKAGSINSCQNLNSENGIYTINSNISSGGNCLNITANNITIDGQGYWINYAQTSSGYGINNSEGFDNITIKNINFNSTNTLSVNAIYTVGMDNSNITNNNFSSNSDDNNGINIVSSDTVEISNNNIYSYRGVIITSSTRMNILKNNVTKREGDGSSSGALDLSNINNSNITNNIFSSRANNVGALKLTNTNNTVFLNNTLASSGSGQKGLIYLDSSHLNTIKNGSSTSSTLYYYYLSDTGSTNNFTNVTDFSDIKYIRFSNPSALVSSSSFIYNKDFSTQIMVNITPITACNQDTDAITDIGMSISDWNNKKIKWNNVNYSTYYNCKNLNMEYRLTNLLPNTRYQIYNTSNSIKTNSYNITSDSNGRLPSFSIMLFDNTGILVINNSASFWNNNTTSLISPQNYNPSNNYGFQINWTDIDNNFANATFQLGRPLGTLTNYTNSSTIKTQYVSGDNYTDNARWYINFTQVQLGGTGTYNYTWFGTDIEGVQNKTDTVNYIINKQPISLSLLPATQTITYETSITQYCSDNSTEYDCTIWKNDTNITNKNNTAEVYGFDVHFFKANISASSENYTWTEQNSTVTVNQKNINIYLALNGTQANKNYNYPDVLNATVWKDTTLNNEGVLTLLENGTSRTNPRIWQPAAKTYNYSTYFTATNYTATSIQDRMAIYSKAPTLTKMFLNNSEASRNYEQGRTANFTATLNVSGKTVYITANMTGWVLQSGTTPKTNTTRLSDIFVYNITGYFLEDENYTASQQSYFATVVNPISINNPTPTNWFYDSQQKTDNFFTNLWNITNNSANIANITFISENKSSGALQTYYKDFLANAVAFNATNCNQTIIAGSSCSIFARYKNILSGSQTMNLTYNITYTDGEKIQNIISTSVSMTNETTTINASYINISLIKVNSTSASINSLSLKGISSTQALWLNATQNLDYEIGNPTSQTLTNVNITLNVPYGYTVNKSQVISSLISGAKRNITFQVNTTDISTFRGWGLDTFWIIANSTQNVDGSNYNMFRLLVPKNITINMDIPGLKELGNTTAGTPITITVNFTNNGAYSIFYPHIFLNLNGTFGFETGHITSKTSTDPTNTVCRTDLNITTNPKTSPINASRALYSIYGWKGAAADTIRTVDLKPSIGILTPDWNESVSYDVNVNNIIIGSGAGSSIDSFIPTITASSLADALSSIVLNQNNNMTFRITPNSVAPSGRYNISYPVCYDGGISSTNDIFSPPLAMKIFIQKDTSDAFRVPGYEDLVRTSTENLAPGASSSTYSFSIIPPSVSETYTISAIVFDDTETGQWFEESKQINALNTYPDKNIAVKDYDYNTSELVANAVENSPRFNMTRRMTVENRNLNNYSMIEWRTVFPGDASNISGTLGGVVENLCGNCVTYPSNISFTLPGISIWASPINYGSSYTTVGSNTTGTVTITQYNNATTQTWYDVKVNATNHVPANYSTTSDLVWFISSLRPERQTTNSISITSSAPAETNWTIARNSTDYYIYNATIEVPNNNTKNREIRYVFDRSRLTDYSSDNLAYTVDGNATNLSYSISSSQFTLTIPTAFNNGQSLDYGNHTVIISYLMASTTVSVGGGGTVYAPAQCNIGYQLIGNICQPTDLGFTVKPDPIVVNISFAEWFSQQKQIEIINTVNRDINLSVETASADGSDKWVSFSAGFQNLKKVELITLNPKSSFSGGSAFLTYSINIPQNATGTYRTDIILKNLANSRSATVRMTINITEGKASIFNILAVIGVATAVLMVAAYLLNRRRKRKKQY